MGLLSLTGGRYGPTAGKFRNDAKLAHEAVQKSALDLQVFDNFLADLKWFGMGVFALRLCPCDAQLR